MNRGKGAAIRTGIEHATGDVIAIQDADPAELPMLLDGKKIGWKDDVAALWHIVPPASAARLAPRSAAPRPLEPVPDR